MPTSKKKKTKLHPPEPPFPPTTWPPPPPPPPGMPHPLPPPPFAGGMGGVPPVPPPPFPGGVTPPPFPGGMSPMPPPPPFFIPPYGPPPTWIPGEGCPPPPPFPPPPLWPPQDDLPEDNPVPESPMNTPPSPPRRRSKETRKKKQSLDEAIAYIRCTSPCRKQIERYQRLAEYAKEFSAAGRSPKLSLEQQADLLALQQQHHSQLKDVAFKKARQHNMVKELRKESRKFNKQERPVTPRHSINTDSAKSPIPTPAGRNLAYIQAKHKMVQDEQDMMDEESYDSEPRIPYHDPIPVTSSPQISPRATGTGVAHVNLSDLLRNASERPSTTPKRGSPRNQSLPTRTLPSDDAARAAATPKSRSDRIAELDALHRKLRKTYLEIQRNPQKFLAQMSATLDLPPGPSHEILVEMVKQQREAMAKEKALQGITFEQTQPSAAAMRARHDVAVLESQWERLSRLQESGLKGDLASAPQLAASYMEKGRTTMPGQEVDQRKVAEETQQRLRKRIQFVENRAGASSMNFGGESDIRARLERRQSTAPP